MKKSFTLLLSFICFSVIGQTHLVISQVYGGGGNTSASYTNDFIELYNPTSAAINVKDYSVQYASYNGTSWTSTTVLPDKEIPPGQYFLIQQASGGAVGAAMPTADATGNTNLSGTRGKVILVSITTASTGSCPTTNVIDKVGYGSADCFEGSAPAAGPTDNIKSVMRTLSNNEDKNQNSTDFTNNNTAVPRNSNFNALPISLNKFLVAKMGNGYAVTWQVTCLSNSVNFQIERSSLSNSGFTSFYSATESKARCASSFTVNDEQPFAGKTYYRLKITNVDGAVNYSKTVLVQNGSIRNAITMKPTIVISNAIIQLTADKEGQAFISVADMQGRIVLKTTKNITAGENELTLSTNNLSKGEFFVNVILNGESLKTRFIKQ
jgi:hypothetical protein